jgi:arabinofuranosyltransferase
VVTPWFIFSLVTFGSPFPNTLGAKLAQGASGFWPLTFVQGGPFWAGRYFQKNVWFYSLLPLGAAGLIALSCYRREYLTLPLWGALYYAAYAALRVPALYHWYYAPVAFALILLMASAPLLVQGRRSAVVVAALWLGMLALAALLLTNISLFSAGVLAPGIVSVGCALAALVLRSRPAVARGALTAAMLLPLLAAQARLSYTQSLKLPDSREIAYREVGLWLKQNTPKDSTFAAAEIGIIGYVSERKVIDYLGLVTPEARQHMIKGDFTWWLRRRAREYVIVRVPPMVFEQPALSDPFFLSNYREAERFHPKDYPELVVYERVGVKS